MSCAGHCRAACHLKLSKSSEAAADCREVLERDPRNVKALFRLGQALVGLKDYEEAIKQLKQAAELEPNDKGITGEHMALSCPVVAAVPSCSAEFVSIMESTSSVC